jgi:tripartite-type tricarboxylate transporter receptor subunit TctC
MKSATRAVLVASFCLTVISVDATAAQPYPNKPIRFIVPFAPGGSADFFARLIAPELTDKLGQQVVIDNRGGAAGTVGAELSARAPSDGYTIALGTANMAMNVSLYPQWPVNPLNDFAAVSLLGSAPNTITVNPTLPAKTVSDLVALAKAKPGQIRYASGGSGSTSHLAGELFKTLAHVDLLHVPYSGTGRALVGLLSGESGVSFPPASVVLPHDKSGKLRALAISSATRFEAAPHLPTVAESGVPGYEASQWYGVLVPAGTPRNIIARLNRELVAVVRNPEFKARLLSQATMVSGTTPEEFANYLRSEIEKWSKVVKFSGARIE